MFNIFCVNFWLFFPMFVTDSYSSHVLVVYIAFTFKAPDVQTE